MELTENGKEFVPVAERLLTLYREAEEIPRRKKSPLLRVSTVNSIAFYLMPAVLKEMMSARDTCSIEFKTGVLLIFMGMWKMEVLMWLWSRIF